MQKGNAYTFGFALAICLFCSIGLALASTSLKPDQDLSARLDVVKNILSVAGMDEKEILRLEKKDPKKLMELYKKEFEARIVDKNNQVVSLETLKSELEKRLQYEKKELDEKEAFEIINIFQKKLRLLAKKAGESVEKYDPKYKLMFLYKPKDEVEAYIVPVEGMGLWDMIYGYIALQPDLITVKDIRFYDQKETPGLGGECSKPWFTNRFKGKRILDSNGKFQGLHVIKGHVEDVITDTAEQVHYVDGISGGTITGDGITAFLIEDLGAYNSYFASIRGNAQAGSRSEGIKTAGEEK